MDKKATNRKRPLLQSNINSKIKVSKCTQEQRHLMWSNGTKNEGFGHDDQHNIWEKCGNCQFENTISSVKHGSGFCCVGALLDFKSQSFFC